ncbi:MAG: glycosyltransferase family 2 protein [bacterium]
MIIFKIIMGLYIFIAGSYWLWQLVLMIRTIKSVGMLEKFTYDETDNWPKLSVVVPARNEANSIEEAVKTRLTEGYPNQEIILVDDRSTDQTGAIIDRVAASDKRVKAVHVKELPEGWIGKLYAMHMGVREATGDWFLFSDADIHFKEGVLKKAVAYSEKRNLDHLGVIPELWARNVFFDILYCHFIKFMMLTARVWDIENPNSTAALGVGAFNLVRRTAFAATKGFEWIKMDVADDLALGKMMKESGARASLVNGCGLLGVYFYNSFGDMARGTERAGFTTLGNFSLWPLMTVIGTMFLLEMFPFVMLRSGIPMLYIIGIIFWVIGFSVYTIGNIWTNRPLWTAFFWPVAITVGLFFALRAGILGKIRGGIYWRGTFYSTEVLKVGKRYSFY